MKLTKNLAKNLAKKYLLNEKTKDGKFLFSHTERVVFCVEILAKKFKLDKEKIVFSAWVHDIGYFLGAEKHAEKSLEILENEKIEIDEEIKDAILNHGTSANPKTIYGKIMQIADKISIIDRNILKILLEQDKIYEEDIKFFEMVFPSCLEMLKKLKDIF
ncbi:MAG: HD domain-containing protein [Candidatus Pacearchaeota archaeon]